MQINVRKKEGQVMILSTVLIGGALLSATAIAGFVLFFQIRQAGDAGQTAAAFYAADTGIENAIYCYYRENHEGNDIDTYCDKSADTQMLGKTNDDCSNPAQCKSLASSKAELSCFVDPTDKTKIDSCKPQPGVEDTVKGIFILSKGTTVRAERVLDYTIITASGN